MSSIPILILLSEANELLLVLHAPILTGVMDYLLFSAIKAGLSIRLIWISFYIGILGNKIADTYATSALTVKVEGFDVLECGELQNIMKADYDA